MISQGGPIDQFATFRCSTTRQRNSRVCTKNNIVLHVSLGNLYDTKTRLIIDGRGLNSSADLTILSRDNNYSSNSLIEMAELKPLHLAKSMKELNSLSLKSKLNDTTLKMCVRIIILITVKIFNLSRVKNLGGASILYL